MTEEYEKSPVETVTVLPDTTLIPSTDILSAISSMYQIKKRRPMPTVPDIALHFLARRLDILESLYQDSKDPKTKKDAELAAFRMRNGTKTLDNYTKMRDAYEHLPKKL